MKKWMWKSVCAMAVVVTVMVVATGCPTDDVRGGASGPTYTVSYSENGADGGAVPIDTNEYREGAVVVVHGNIGEPGVAGSGLHKAEHSFGGWRISDTAQSLHSDHTFVMPGENVTLAAVWLGDGDSPVPGGWGTITVTERQNTSVTLSWDAATDDMASSDTLEYAVYVSTEPNIGTVQKAVENGTLLDTEASMTEVVVTDLETGGEYFFNVVVSDTAGNAAAYSQQSGRAI